MVSPDWTSSKKRFFSFIENELQFHPVTMKYLSENVPSFQEYKERFAEKDSFIQAHIMHGGIDSFDSEFQVFFNLRKLNGNPIIIENKDFYNLDDLVILCMKVTFKIQEGLHYCTEDEKLQNKIHERMTKEVSSEEE